MPVIKIQHVVSCSSEDRVHNSENMLLSDHYRKWKSSQAGEKQISILLQLEKASVIHSIDIGNENSAFVEILVGRSSDTNKDFQVLLVSSSFMTPTESRQNSNPNRVRMFGPDKLSQTVSKDKWDLVKIVCTQPFNKSTQYGLSFVVFHSPPEKNSEVKQEPDQQTSLGAFKLKTSDESESSLHVGTWFAKRKSESQDIDVLSTPAAIKAADVTVKRPENSQTILTSKKRKLSNDDNVNLNKSNGITSASKDRHSDPVVQKKTPEPRKFVMNPKPSTSGVDTTKNQSNVRIEKKLKTKNVSTPKRSDKTKKAAKRDVPFHKLLEGTVFALSGYQNPKRGQIRDRAIEMGAVYKPDWEKKCTHLVCAFPNTPKFQQVHSKGGRIVKESWILECAKQKKHLPWRQFMLGKSSHPETSESEDTDVEDERKPVQQLPRKTFTITKPEKLDSPARNNSDIKTNSQRKTTKSPSKTRSRSPSPSAPDSDTVYGADTDVDSDSGCDTETEISKVVAKKSDRKSDTSNLDLPRLPDIFKGEHFFMYGDFNPAEKKRLIRFIIGCGGVLEDYMSNDVRCVLTNSKWNRELTDAIDENSSLRILKPLWVNDCVEQGKQLPKNNYFVPKR